MEVKEMERAGKEAAVRRDVLPLIWRRIAVVLFTIISSSVNVVCTLQFYDIVDKHFYSC